MGGRTLLGTPVSRRTKYCFPAESVDVFWQMDQVATGPARQLAPLDFDADGDGQISRKESDAIRGRNTWLLWGGGNEVFWGWLQERGYGLVDFLILMDSRQRDSRFRRAGMINQPGFTKNNNPDRRILGLYFDLPIESEAKLTPPPWATNSTGKVGASRFKSPALSNGDASCFHCHARAQYSPDAARLQEDNKRLFTPGDRELYDRVRDELGGKLARDGLDPEIYGYASGIFGLRLFLNPDFFGNTTAAAKARDYWNERVVSGQYGDYYKDQKIHADPKLIRPFRVSMSCGFCHVGPHPLNPPADPENPKWENLSSIIGDQFWSPQPAFGNLLRPDNFLFHFLNSQPPGTIDTSLVSTDHLNNPNTINAIFDLPARLARAERNTPELQSPENLLMGSIEDGDAALPYRHFPRVLLDGADSCGALVALLRVPINIGTYSEEWSRCHNPIVGFKPQRPFRVEACQKCSVYWQANEQYRIPYLAAFFTFTNHLGQSSTAPMKLRDAHAAHGAQGDITDEEKESTRAGRGVFLRHCAICHSSKQPEGFDIQFQRDMPGGWENAPPNTRAAHYTLPMDFAYWDRFKISPSYQRYVTEITQMAGDAPADPYGDDPFLTDNFLSSEVRIPITLVGSNSGRAAATNAKRGQVWDNFSSEGYKALPSAGFVRYYNPYSSQLPDAYGNNDSYYLDGGGPGYYRPPSLISLWATAPYLHNNTLGVYEPVLSTNAPVNPGSVEARLAAFEDGITKLLWNQKRAQRGKYESAQPLAGDLRRSHSRAAARDPGYIYRLPQDTYVMFAAPFVRPLVEGVVGRFNTRLVAVWLPILLILIFALAAWKGQARHAGIAFIFLALVLAAFLTVTGLGSAGGAISGVMMTGATNLFSLAHWAWWLLVLALAAAGAGFLFFFPDARRAAQWVLVLVTALTIAGTLVGNAVLNGRLGRVKLGPIPKGTPVNLLMNIDPQKKEEVSHALTAMFRAIVDIRRNDLKGDDAFRVFDREAGPALLQASKCPDFVLDRGHWFGEHLSDQEKEQLIAFLKTL